ncbi:sodium-dependent noradrenaline transporter-like [Spodoptera litura]|uniref:Sodium-dependent noradrenaline transporter-like n=1 Tax=Spodoptera litura TaxID=69820 RepID=A0A9J7E698_SPOLT|nr:sodium-dependent noradrenaline transporter-like [Spodoptera litura]
MFLDEIIEMDGYFCPKLISRWDSYSNYRLVLWAWMMNELTVMFCPVSTSHSGFYAQLALQTLAVVLVGMPLAYSEICLAQYTNSNIFTMWNFFPLFRNVGYGTLFLIWLKTIYLLVLTSWYLVYTFYSALDVPPWLSCDDFGDTKCMVKRVNVSVFQHCLEAQILFEDDCGMKTASNCFFEREIGGNSTLELGLYCLVPWKTIVALLTVCGSVYVLSIKNEKMIQIVVKLAAFYVCAVILILFCVALSTSGTWYASKYTINWNNYTFVNCYRTITRGFLSVGTGYGIINFLTSDVAFRSPATMTAISTPLFSLFISFMLALISFSGIKTMSYYHGEEENVIELGTNPFFAMFASMSEILSYFNGLPIWGFLWFSTGFFCLYINFWILYLFLKEFLENNEIVRTYTKLSCLLLFIFIMICTLPFLCSDITAILTDATEFIQAINSLFFSIALYWFYGIHKHTVDIVFMIGIKTNYLLKIVWLLNPIFICIILYSRWEVIETYEYEESYYIDAISMTTDLLIFYILLSTYLFIIVVGLVTQMFHYINSNNFRGLFKAKNSWGPTDRTLFRSRRMFVPEIMTREFLYRQVRIRGYNKRKEQHGNESSEKHSGELIEEQLDWNAMMST